MAQQPEYVTLGLLANASESLTQINRLVVSYLDPDWKVSYKKMQLEYVKEELDNLKSRFEYLIEHLEELE
jgi:ubiquinone biosynthesis protein UbiJ